MFSKRRFNILRNEILAQIFGVRQCDKLFMMPNANVVSAKTRLLFNMFRKAILSLALYTVVNLHFYHYHLI